MRLERILSPLSVLHPVAHVVAMASSLLQGRGGGEGHVIDIYA